MYLNQNQERELKKEAKPTKAIFLVFLILICLIFSSFVLMSLNSNIASISESKLLAQNTGTTKDQSIEKVSILNINAIFRLIKKITLDLSILKDFKFSSLIEYGRAPQVKEKGRVNPFEPY